MTAQHAPGVGAGRPLPPTVPIAHQTPRDNHRFLAARLAQLAEFVEDNAFAPTTGADESTYLRGYQAALLDTARHLKSGDYLSGGLLNCAELAD